MYTKAALLSTAALLTLALGVQAQTPVPILPPGQPPTVIVRPPAPGEPTRIAAPQAAAVPQLSEAQLADLTASIALYPDPLLAEMFPATTFVEELAYADRWLAQHPGAEEKTIARLPLEEPVKCMLHYPTVLNLMAEHLDWTQALGIAFANQRPALFESVQRWRATAVACGTLYSTPQQEVLQQGAAILIQPPARTEVVYVPAYDPAVVYVKSRVAPAAPRNLITFSTSGFALSFAANDLDWREHEVRIPRTDLAPGAVVGAPEAKTVFVPNKLKPGLAYPLKVLTPQPDRKVIELVP